MRAGGGSVRVNIPAVRPRHAGRRLSFQDLNVAVVSREGVRFTSMADRNGLAASVKRVR